MHRQRNRIFVGLFLTLLAMAFAGCRQKTETYDSLRGSVLADLAEALRQNETQDILRAADRLEELTDQKAFVEKLRAREKRRGLITQLNSALANADLDSCAGILRSNSDLIAEHAQLASIPRTLDALVQLKTYLAKAPYPDSESMAAALRNVQRVAGVLSRSRTFTTWLQGELDTLAALRRHDRREKAEELLRICDETAISGSGEFELAFARFRDFDPDSQIAHFYSGIRDGDTSVMERLLENGEPAVDPLLVKGLEIGLWKFRDKVAKNTYMKLCGSLSGAAPASMSGYALRIDFRLRQGDESGALLWTRRYLDSGGRPLAGLLEEVVAEALLPAQQFNARIWRKPFPDIGDIISRIVQWRSFHSGRGEAD